jgi:hypothetical protein
MCGTVRYGVVQYGVVLCCRVVYSDQLAVGAAVCNCTLRCDWCLLAA